MPIIADKDGVIIAGHTRFEAAKKIGLEVVPVIIADDLNENQIRAFRLIDNKTAELADWDFDLLAQELENIDFNEFEFDAETFDFGDLDLSEETPQWEERPKTESLFDKFIIPPFSTLDSRAGYWQARKNTWKTIIKSGDGREDALLGKGLQNLAKNAGSKSLTGTSIFDPVLCEVLLNWFCPSGGRVIDPFAGGSVRGLITSFLGNDYTGIDLRREQIDANEANFEELKDMQDFTGAPLKRPNWINGDSSELNSLVPAKDFDFLLTCPPYADLEVYSDDPRDISTMDYADFLATYRKIISLAVEKLKENAFAAIVVGDVRENHKYYRNFVGATIQAFQDAGAKYYNECILLESIATAALRANRQFSALRKVVKVHQNVLIFVKGDEKKIELPPYDYDFDNLDESAL